MALEAIGKDKRLLVMRPLTHGIKRATLAVATDNNLFYLGEIELVPNQVSTSSV